MVLMHFLRTPILYIQLKVPLYRDHEDLNTEAFTRFNACIGVSWSTGFSSRLALHLSAVSRSSGITRCIPRGGRFGVLFVRSTFER
jgi:hypothetical protein